MMIDMILDWVWRLDWWPFVALLGFVWAPKTWTPGELVSAAAMNTNIRDHLNESLRTQATALTGSQNNFALEGPFAYLKCSNASALTITGALIDGGNVDGAKVIIESLNKAVTLKNLDAGSATSNRIITPNSGSDLTLLALERALLIYDGTASRWRASRFGFFGGIGTVTVPHGGKGMARLAIDGPNANTDGPHAQITTDTDDYPLLHFYMWAHDTLGIGLDAYHEGGAGWLSSDVGSNFVIVKAADILKIFTDAGVAQGGACSLKTAIAITPDARVGIGTTSIDVSAKLEISSTTGALLLPRMTTAQRDALTAVNGMLIYNSNTNKIEGYENGSWVDI